MAEKRTEIVHAPKVEPPALAPMTPMALLEHAVTNGASMEAIEKLMDLQQRWEASQSRKAFDIAMANAQADMPVIVKRRLVEYGEGNKKTSYKHEDLSEILRLITPVLKLHGLAVRFRTEQLEGGQVRVYCVLTGHGHREENPLQSSRDTSGGKNDIQAVGSVVSYLQRYTLKAALGLAAAADDDGQASEGSNNLISDDQAGELVAMIESTGADKPKFLAYFKIDKLGDLPAKSYQMAVQLLNAKARK